MSETLWNPNRRWAHFGLFVVLFLAVADHRLHFAVATGGRGTLTISAFALPALAILFLVRFGIRAFTPLSSPAILWWLPYLFLSVLLPMLSVLVGWYPERALFAGFEAILAVTLVVIGGSVAVSLGSRSDELPWLPWLAIASLVHAGYALVQRLTLAGVLTGPPWTALQQWDLTTQAQFGELVAGRSSGFYINPNILGLWGAVVVILGLQLRAPMARLLVFGGGGLSLLLSQSRGSIFAVVLTLLVTGLRTSAHGTRVFRGIFLGLGVSILIATILLAVGFLDVAVFERLYLGLAATLGAGTDPGVTGRMNLWGGALDLLNTRPLGTLGPPEFLLGAPVDNGWIRVLVQGSIPYAASLAIALLPSALRPLSSSDAAMRLGSFSMLIALTAVSQTPLSYPPAILYWFVVGVALVQDRQRRDAETPGTATDVDLVPAARNSTLRPSQLT